ncbi:MAG: diaminopimelate epimerase [Bacteroidia bacterium]|nr:diaminopimelate epimerase [Bacteroidia bacterium]
MNLTFFKYQGTGNDFVMIDNREGKLTGVFSQEQIAFLCDRRFGIGADGFILLSPAEDCDFRMIYFNSDGRESTMCGNGGRCLVAFAFDRGIRREVYRFEAVDGLHEATLEKGIVSLEMIQPRDFRRLDESAWWLNTGSPHYVRFSNQPVAEINVYEEGKTIRYSPDFAATGGTNVNFVNILSPDRLKVRTYERGVEDETFSCGTGVTACAYTHLFTQTSGLSKVVVETKGGTLAVEVLKIGTPQERVFLQGPARFVFKGEINL